MVTTNQARPTVQHRSSSSSSPVQQQISSDRKSINKSTQRRTQSLTPESLMHEQDSAHRRPSSPVMSSTPRLSIADRFMSSSGYQHSPLTSSPLSYTSPIPTESEEDTGSTYAIGARTNNIHANSITRPASSNSSSIINDNSPNPSRLTIASAFMKSSSSSISSSTAAKQNGSNTNGTIHPLDNISDSTSGSLDLNLNLTTPTSTTPSLYLENRYSRPFGSQDTLVSNDLDNKKQQYQRQKLHGSIEEGEHYGNSSNDYYQRQQHDHHSDDDDDGHENESDLSSTTRHGDEENDLEFQQNKVNGKHAQQHMDDDDLIGEPRGCWIGCCFLSCGDRSSSKKAMKKQAQLKQQQKRQQKQQKQQQQQQQRTCGRRWRVFALFLSTLFLIILSSIFWPRTPLIRIEGASLLSPAKVTETSQGAMLGNVQFESQWMVNFTVDNRQNWLLPTRLVQFHLLVKDALTGNVVGKGFQNDHPESVVLDPRAISTVQMGVYLDYQARDVSDTTFSSLKKACVTSSPTMKRRSLLMARGDGNGTMTTTPMDQHNTNNATNHTMATNGSNTNSNQTISTSPPPAPPPAAATSTKEHESLSLLFWVTLHIWGLDVFGYKPTVMVAPATGGFVCPLA
ncbi:hypothetical protein BCR42DRAFT_495192 [Absidia repens]|uniref:Uncharacterized protein n=1 Tax=Absidia repens TaxID=90262 RepID=A0A1X2I411_9FUNG|nr:hypothetical protein BCR42DRAFT_495192 [Absidia repens]